MTIFNAFVLTLDKATGDINPLDYAKQVFKGAVDENSAVVNILSSTGIAGFQFHVPQSEQVRMESEITDHYTDNNSVIQDHIARKPVRITLVGLQGEYFYSVHQIKDILALVTPTLALVKQFLPKLSPVTMKLKTEYNNQMLSKLATNTSFGNEKELNFTDKLVSSVRTGALNSVDLFKIFQDLYKLKSPQTRAFLFFEALWRCEERFTVETSWKRFDNMVIESVLPIRDNNADITDFTVTFKQMYIAQSLYTNLENAAGRTRDQLMKKVNKGIDKGEQKEAV